MLDKRKFYINGQWVDPSKKNDFEVINPSDESVCAIISLGSKEDTNAAVAAAREALPMWSRSTKEDRIALLERLYSIYQSRMDEMAEVISIEMGAPIDFSKAAQAPSGTNAIEDFLNQLRKFEFEQQLQPVVGTPLHCVGDGGAVVGLPPPIRLHIILRTKDGIFNFKKS